MEQSNMMPNGMSGQLQGMQRAQGNDQFNNLFNRLVEDMRTQMAQFVGSWQATHDLRERANRILQLITQLRLINPDINKCLQIAQSFEFRSITEAQSKDQYNQRMDMKFDEIVEKRRQNVQMAQMNGGPMMQNNGAGMQNGGMMAMAGNGMQNNGTANMGFPHGMGGQAGQMNGGQGQNPMFPTQLQRPMQPSPLPMQQQQQQQPTTMNPAALHMNQQQQQSQQIRAQNMNQPGQQQPQPPNTQGGQGQPGQQMPPEVIAMAKSMFNQMPEDQRNGIRQKLIAGMSEQARAAIAQTGRGDPLLTFLGRRAFDQFKKRPQGTGAGSQQSNTNMQAGNNNMNVSMGNLQRPPSQAESQNIDFSTIIGQQANALKLQESGNEVVPASNNNNNNQNGLNQMNMSQGINPQMLGNQNPGGQGMNQSQMQYYFSQQKDAQQREAMHKHLMANRQGMQQRQQNGQLHGQPGGLHTPNVLGGAPGQVNSPAMSMLNRPMAPPGQATPGTPQPTRQQPMPATPMTGASQLAQHHQSMLQNNQQQQQMNQMPSGQMNPQLAFVLSKLPAQMREKLLQMPSHQAQEFLNRYRATLSKHQSQQNASNAPNMSSMGNAQSFPNMSMAAPPQSLQQGSNMMQQHMGSATPGFGSQPPQNQQAMQMDPSAPAQMQNRMAMQHQMKIRSQAMDQMVFPKITLQHLRIGVPQQVQRWGELRMHIQQNMSSMPPGTLETVQRLQAQYFQSPGRMMEAMQHLQQQRQNGMQAQQLQQQMQSGQIPNDAAPQAPSMADRPAPQTQVVPPAPMMQAPPHGLQTGANGGPPRPQSSLPVTPQDMQGYRAKQPQAAGWDDNTVRQMILKGRAQMQARAQAQQAQINAQAQAAPHQKQAPAQAGHLPRLPNQVGTGPQGGLPAQNQSQRAQHQKPHQPSNDDVIEISSQTAKQTAPQAPPMQPSASQSQPQMPRLSQEQLAKMSPVERDAYVQKMQRAQQQHQQMQSLRNAQGQLTAPNNTAGLPSGQGPAQAVRPSLTPEQQERLKRLYSEVVKANPKGKAVTCDAAGFERAKSILKKVWGPLQRISTTFPLALHLRYSDERIKDVLRWQNTLHQNAKDSEGNVKDFLAVTPEQLQALEQGLAGYMRELTKARQHQSTAGGFTQQKQAQQPSTAAPGQLQQGHVRKASANVKAPPAPTENKTFDWAAPSPHGIPKYDTRNELTPDKLKFPPNKKRKTGDSQTSTPASPAIGQGKGQTTELARKSQPQKVESQYELQRLRCSDSTCDASVRGFETEGQLKQHEQAQHQPIKDPLAFLLDNASSALGGDKATAAGSSDLKPALRKEEQQPAGRGGAAPDTSTSKPTKKQDVDSSKANKVEKKDETLWDSLADKIGMPAPVAEANVPSADLMGPDMNTLWDGGIMMYNNGWPSEEDFLASTKEVYDVMSWQYKYCELVDPATDRWELRPGTLLDPESSPELTPASSDSSHASDVSQSDAANFVLTVENFDDQFGVPQSMIPLYHQIKGMLSDEDTIMGDSGEKINTESVEASKRRRTQEANALVQDFWQNFLD